MMMMSSPEAPPPNANAVSWNLDEFNKLAARADAEPNRVLAATALYQAKLINFSMFKDLLSLKD
jgi:hypothetical protein